MEMGKNMQRWREESGWGEGEGEKRQGNFVKTSTPQDEYELPVLQRCTNEKYIVMFYNRKLPVYK